MMENDLTWFMAANIVTWLGIGLYVLHMGRRQAWLEKRLRQMETQRDA